MRKGMRKKSFFALLSAGDHYWYFTAASLLRLRQPQRKIRYRQPLQRSRRKKQRETPRKKILEILKKNRKQSREYIDEAYVDENYGEGQEEDLSKYKSVRRYQPGD